MEKPEPFMLRERNELHLDEIEQDQGKLRRALKHVTRLLQDAEQLIEKQRR
jgi:ribosomal protein S2